MEFSLLFWISFLIIISLALALDLGIFNKKAHTPSYKEAALTSLGWVSLAGLFSLVIYFTSGSKSTLEFITGYLVELSLSIDNIFVFILIFSYFKIPPQFQHKILFWGIVGAVIMRFIMITGGIYLINRFEWLFYIFAALLIYSGYHIAFKNKKDEEDDLKNNFLIKLIKKYFNCTTEIKDEQFFKRIDGKLFITPLFIALIFVEKSDLIFAMDSIPAIFAITKNPFIVFTSNIFAILGLRSMYFLVSNLMQKLYYIKYGLAAVLSFVGVKILLSIHFKIHIPVQYSLGFIVLAIGMSILYSLINPKRQQ